MVADVDVERDLTLDLVADFGTLVGIPVGDLAALTGITLSEEPHTQEPAAADMAELIWDLRRLTADQVRHTSEAAASMRPTRLHLRGCSPND